MKAITTNENANKLLAYLCAEYDNYSVYCVSGTQYPLPRYFFHDYGQLYVRKMYINEALCIPSVDFDEEVRGFGVLTHFIEHVKENPNCFKFLEIENILNERLAGKLTELGFKRKAPKAGEPAEAAPTYIIEINNEQPEDER